MQNAKLKMQNPKMLATRLEQLILCVISVVLVAGGAYAQNKPATPTLTTQDYIDIQQLAAQYAFLIDTCTNGGNDFADLFTPDGEFSVSQQWGVAGERRIKGRAALIDAGKVKVTVDATYPLAAVAKAHEHVERRRDVLLRKRKHAERKRQPQHPERGRSCPVGSSHRPAGRREQGQRQKADRNAREGDAVGRHRVEALGQESTAIAVVGVSGDPVAPADRGHALAGAFRFQDHVSAQLGHADHPQGHPSLPASGWG